jgi:hypothetical protein
MDIAHQGVIEFQNRETGVQGAFNLWQVSKLLSDEFVPGIGPDDILCNVLEMVNKGWLKELFDPIINTDNDSRRFSITVPDMLQFRKEILPVAQMLVNQEQELEQRIQNTSRIFRLPN